MNEYLSAFQIECDRGPIVKPVHLDSEKGIVYADVYVWWDSTFSGEGLPPCVHTAIQVPLVQPVRFDWDRGIYGHIVRFYGSPVERFCHPRLRSDVLDHIAVNANRGSSALLDDPNLDPKFYFESWFGRVRRALLRALSQLYQSSQLPRVTLIERYLRNEISAIVFGDSGTSGLPITGPEAILRQRYEVELGYPDVPTSDVLFERIKALYLRHADRFCQILETGKRDVGRFVMRVRPDSPVNIRTGRPVSGYQLAVDPMATIEDPLRAFRENRALIHAHVFTNPEPPRIRAKGTKLPEPLARRITRMVVAVCDIPGWNVYTASQEDVDLFSTELNPLEVGDETCLDEFLVTPSGRKKLAGSMMFSASLDWERYAEEEEKVRELPEVEVQRERRLIEILPDGTQVFTDRYRYRSRKEIPVDADKIKSLVGGLKGTLRPQTLPQLYARIGDEAIPIDLVIAESALVAKGAFSAGIYMLADLVGITEIDPTNIPALKDEIARRLAERGLPASGRFEIAFRKRRVKDNLSERLDEESRTVLAQLGWDPEWEVIGTALVGGLPIMRAEESAVRQSHSRGVSLTWDVRLQHALPLPDNDQYRQQAAGFAQAMFHALDSLERSGDLPVEW